jgi:hypothetical protein
MRYFRFDYTVSFKTQGASPRRVANKLDSFAEDLVREMEEGGDKDLIISVLFTKEVMHDV